MTPRLKGVLIALAGTTAWATTGIFISYLLTRYNLAPLTLAFWRDLAVAATLIAILAVFQPQALRLTRRDVPFFLAYGFVALALFNGLWTYSVKFNGAAVATVLAYSSPAFTVLLAGPLLKEPFTRRKLAAVILGLAGCVLVAKAYRPEVWQVNLAGILVGLGTGRVFAIYSLAGRWSSSPTSTVEHSAGSARDLPWRLSAPNRSAGRAAIFLRAVAISSSKANT